MAEDHDEQTRQMIMALSNPDFQAFLKEWKTLDDTLRSERDAVKEWRKKQNTLATNIVDYMENNQLTGFVLKLKDGGSIKYMTSRRKSGLNKKHIYNRLMIYFEGDEEKAAKLTEFILDGQEVVEVPRLSRRAPRAKNIDDSAVP